MSSALETFLKRNRELCEASTPGPWELTKYTILAETHGKLGIVGWTANNKKTRTAMAANNAALMAASRTSLPLALEMLSMACEALEKIGHTQDVSPADPETGGPCRIATANSRNRRILEAQDALRAIEAKAKESQ